MKTIKIIDLLTKIANGEEVPKKIKWGNDEWEYGNGVSKNYHSDYEDLFTAIDGSNLTDEIEILDEEDEFKHIEKLNLEQDELVNNKDIRPIDYLFEGTINELIINQQKIIERLKDE